MQFIRTFLKIVREALYRVFLIVCARLYESSLTAAGCTNNVPYQ